jgi:hypothetical protein
MAGPQAAPGAGQGPSILIAQVFTIVFIGGVGQSTGKYIGLQSAGPPQESHAPQNAKDVPAVNAIAKIPRTATVLLTIPSSSFHQSLFKEA